MKRVLLMANKTWEVEPVINAIVNNRFSPDAKLNIPSILNYPWIFPQGYNQPRAIWYNYSNIKIELWCLQDLMDISNPSDNELFSSSELKELCIHKAFDFQKQPRPDLVIALGTASWREDPVSRNGCVSVGKNVFINNFHPKGQNPKSKWDDPRFEKLIPSLLEDDFFDLFDPATISAIETGLISPFFKPATNIELLIQRDGVALSSVNVTNSGEFGNADGTCMKLFEELHSPYPVVSVETTHGIIRLAAETRFVFVSGITDRYLKFGSDVLGKDPKGHIKKEAQNFSVAFNIGVFLSCALPKIAPWLSAKN